MRTLPIFLAFFLMGLADAMGPNADRVKNAYQLSNVMSTMLPFVVFIAFAVFSVPGGLLAARIGKKKLLMLGLGINALALVIPSFLVPSFPVLLGCIFWQSWELSQTRDDVQQLRAQAQNAVAQFTPALDARLPSLLRADGPGLCVRGLCESEGNQSGCAPQHWFQC